MLSLFRFSSTEDQLLTVVGVLGAIVAAFGIPLLGHSHAYLLNPLVEFSHAKLLYNEKKNNANAARVAALREVFQEELYKFCYRCSVYGVLVMLGGYVMLLTFTVASEHQAKIIRKALYGRIISEEITWHDAHPTGELMALIQLEVTTIQEGIGEKMAFLVHFLAGFVISIAMAVLLGWELSLLLFAALPILVLVTFAMNKIQQQLGNRETKAYAKAGNTAQEAINSIRTVVSFGGETKEVKQYEDDLSLAEASTRNRGLVTGLGAAVLWFVTYTIFAVGFWFGSSLVLRSRRNGDKLYTPGIIFNVFYNVLFAAMYLGQAIPYFEAVTHARASASKIWSILDRVPSIDSFGHQGIKPSEFKGTLRMAGVDFHYPSRPDLSILRDFNLTINPGETIALVGPSGGGKSTVFQLLLRFYDPVKGLVLFDDYDVRDLNVSWYRRQIGIVAQEPVLFSGTIGDNIRCGRDDATAEEVQQAAMLANIHRFISSLPLGYDTYLGGSGGQLSGGQKQRIAIARAILQRPRILLLDEATSALDSESERLVQQALDTARMGRTTIMIAHRLSTIRNAHKIVVIVNGRIMEEGTHEDLLDQMGIYHELINSQTYPLKMQPSGDSIPALEHQRRSRAFDSLSADFHVDDPALEHQRRSRADTLSTEYHRDELDQPFQVSTGPRTLSIQSKESRISLLFKNEEEETPPIQRPIVRILRLSAPEWPFILAGCVVSVILGLTWPLDSILAAEILGAFNNLDDAFVERQTKFLSLHFFIIATTSSVSGFFQPFLFSISGSHMTKRIRSMTFAAILRQEIAWFDDPHNNTGSLCSKLAVDAARIQAMTGLAMGTVVQSFSTLTFCFIMSFYFHWQLTLLSFIAVPFIFAISYFQSKVLVQQYSRREALYEHSWQIANETFLNVRTIAAMGNEHYFFRKFIASLPKVKWNQRSIQVRCFVFGISLAAILFCYAGSWYAGGYYIISHDLEYKIVLKVTEMLIFGSVMVAQAMILSPGFLTSGGIAKQVFALWDRKPLLQSSDTNFIPKRMKARIHFRNVYFSYPVRPDVTVLKGLSFQVEPEHTVALVGESGSGKSTCTQLLQRYYDPSSGKILLDGFDIKTLDLSWLRSNMSIVSQEPALFNRTIEDNIAYGDNSREIPLDEVIKAAQTANIHSFILSLPQGYDTVVGDKGCFLSGGQKQRIAIARALIRNPKLLLLDEATSALDMESERIVQSALDKAGEGRTCIVIAHRLSTIVNADKIVVMHNGIVVEEGTHSELMDKQGFYYHLSSGVIH